MKVLYFKVKNFATIFSAMKRKVIEIDYRKSKNRIILYVGENGSGKTSIMSQLHPFANSGNMDVRSSGDLILPEEDGYKEIHIQKNEDVYVIKHYYLQASGKGMKSYIAKNGTEMNPNGNVTSFKEVVETELSITQDYLKLMRLGANVTNFIKMKSSERKNFTSDLLSEIDVYTKMYKKINDDSRLLKTLMKSVTDKIAKLKVVDEADEVKRKDELEARLQELKGIRDSITSEIGRIDGSINILVPDGLENFIAEIKLNESEYKRISGDINTKKNKMDKFNIIILGSIEKTIKETEKEISSNENQIIINKNMIEFYFNQLNSLYEQKKEKEDSLKYVASEVEYNRLNDLYLKLNRDKEVLSEKFKGMQPKCTRDEILLALSILQEIEKFAEDIYEHNTDAVVSVLNHHLKGQNAEWIARKEVTKIDEKMSKLNRSIAAQAQASNVNSGVVYALYQPPGCDCQCPFQRFYEDVTGVKSEAEKKDDQTELKRLETQREFFLAFPDISKKVDYILLLIKSNKALIEKMPEDFFNIQHILKSIKDFTPFYDENYITNYVSLIEEYETFKQIDSQIKDVLKERTFIEKNSGSIVSIQKELESLDTEIYTISKDLETLKSTNEELTNRNSHLESLLEDYVMYQEYSESIKLQEVEAKDLLSELEKKQQTKSHVSELVTVKQGKARELISVDRDINTVEMGINNIRFRLMEFNSLTEEKNELEDKFEDINIIKEALSSNKGIPLLFIQLYLRNTRIIANQLLDSIYHGDLELLEFDINEKEFRIPYRKNGIIVNDVVHCSQGEETFISIALSFALSEQSNIDYNIMLWDEIDATLDTRKRTEFLNIIDTKLDNIEAEQVHMITHNNMFDNYPVDVIMTSDVSIDNYKNVNVIFKA